MKEFLVRENEAGQRLDKLLHKIFRDADKSFIYKMLRKKNFVLNGKKAQGNEILVLGDEIKLFLSDDTFAKMTGAEKSYDKGTRSFTKDEYTDKNADRSRTPDTERRNRPADLDIVYQDKDIIMINKPAGMLSQKAKPEDISLVEYLTLYLLQQGTLTEEELMTFHPALCNRLDRNTSGLVVAGKSLKGLQDMAELMRNRTMGKYYRCIVEGELRSESRIEGYLHKDEKTNKVTIRSCSNKETLKTDTKAAARADCMAHSMAYSKADTMENTRNTGAEDKESYILTEYRPLCVSKGMTYLEVRLITGKTHQIRAHLASIGHPITGDVKYGGKQQKRQMLHSYRVEFPYMQEGLTALSEKKILAPLPQDFKKQLERYQLYE